jgi:hypothetical protein
LAEIEYLTVANHAEAINGLLYLQGAGWTDIQQQVGSGGPGFVHFGIAISIIMGWNETNKRFPLALRLTDEDGVEYFNLNAQTEAGRPAGVPVGSDMRSVLALNAEVQFPKSGGYELRAELGEKARSVAFRVQQPLSPFGAAGHLPPS